jgi:hypothetical protein
MATKPKRIEDMSEAELIESSGKAYDKIMPSPEPGEQKPPTPKWGGKTAIGNAAAKASFDKNWAKNESKEATMNRVTKARDEADSEVKRETRGKVPGLKTGGMASSRADGCCTKGKTRGKMY